MLVKILIRDEPLIEALSSSNNYPFIGKWHDDTTASSLQRY